MVTLKSGRAGRTKAKDKRFKRHRYERQASLLPQAQKRKPEQLLASDDGDFHRKSLLTSRSLVFIQTAAQPWLSPFVMIITTSPKPALLAELLALHRHLLHIALLTRPSDGLATIDELTFKASPPSYLSRRIPTNRANMGLKANFEEIPALLAPPSYLDSTSDDHVQLSSRQESHSNTNIAPRYIAWKLILRTLIGSAQTTALQDLDQEEERAAALLDVLSNIRLVSRLLYSVSMSLLRPMYFAEYLKAIQATVYSTNLENSSLDQPCRDTRVLDHYISYRIQRRHLASQSSLLLNNDDIESDQRQVFRDLFKWFQPRTYMEDEIGKVLHSSAAPSNAVRFEDLLVRFHFTRAAITLPFAVESTPLSSSTSAPTIVRKECVSLGRASNEPVFVTAHRLFDQLNCFIFVRKAHGSKTWYEIVGQTG